jgi:hypothetical protein
VNGATLRWGSVQDVVMTLQVSMQHLKVPWQSPVGPVHCPRSISPQIHYQIICSMLFNQLLVVQFWKPFVSRWLRTLILAEDANFKQKARLRSGTTDSDALGPGWGMFVSHVPYLDYVSQFADQKEVSPLVIEYINSYDHTG